MRSFEAFALDVINSVLWVKLGTIFAAILDASTIGNWWLIVDRIAAKSPAAEILIEAAMQQTSSRPTCVVIDSTKRLQNFRGEKGDGDLYPGPQSVLDKLELIKGGCVGLVGLSICGSVGLSICGSVCGFQRSWRD